MKNNLLNDTKIRIKENALLLGGGSRSKLWSQILSDILGIEMWAPQVGDASFGSALLGGIGVHVFKNPQDAMKKCTKISKKIHPNPKKYAIYQKTFNLYQEIHKKLEDLSMRLNNTI